MVDRELERQIKKAKDFTQLWMRFRELYQGALGRSNILPEEEKTFLELKSTLVRQYQGLLESLNLSHTPDDKTFDVTSSILSLASISTLSEMQYKKIENDWHSSYLNLNRILGSLENKKEQIGKINTTKVAMDSFFSSHLVSFILVILLIVAGYVILVQILHVDEFIKQNLSCFLGAKK